MRLFSGTIVDIGRQKGLIYKKNSMNLDSIKINGRIFQNQLKAYQTHFPAILDEIRMTAKSSGIDENKMVYYQICRELLWCVERVNLINACTVFGVNTRQGCLVGRNFDWLARAAKYFQVYTVAPLYKNSFVAVSDMGISNLPEKDNRNKIFTVNDAINSRGLYIGLTYAFNSKYGYGLTSSHVIRLIVETCATVTDVLKLFEKVALCCPKNFFIADVSGNMAVVEHDSHRFKVIYPRKGILVKTNHYIDTDLAKEDEAPIVMSTSNSFLRYDKTMAGINSLGSRFEFSDIYEILGNPKYGIYQGGPKIRTIWTLALNTKLRRYWLYQGKYGVKQKITQLIRPKIPEGLADTL
ncbi:MAG: C45 family peptidase [Candidatus Woesearchaeota archaeon]